uniref:Grainyhead like transcription factor 1 n=1 Tax=Macaca mulatta TaxID=9544 RepID=F7G8T4_MACMU
MSGRARRPVRAARAEPAQSEKSEPNPSGPPLRTRSHRRLLPPDRVYCPNPKVQFCGPAAASGRDDTGVRQVSEARESGRRGGAALRGRTCSERAGRRPEASRAGGRQARAGGRGPLSTPRRHGLCPLALPGSLFGRSVGRRDPVLGETRHRRGRPPRLLPGQVGPTRARTLGSGSPARSGAARGRGAANAPGPPRPSLLPGRPREPGGELAASGQVDFSSKRPVLVLQNEALYPQRRSYTSEDEAWKSFLENPLTAATKAMMSINGDEDSAAALGLLYDYYKVPRERRSSTAKPEVEHPEPDHSKRNSIPIVTEQPLISAGENRVQVLKNVPFNIVLPHGNQLGIDKRGHLTAPDTTVTVSIATMPTHSIKTETQPHGFAVGIPPAVYHPEPTERVVVFDRNLSTDQFSSGAQAPNAQRRTPDSTFSETFKEGVQEEQL